MAAALLWITGSALFGVYAAGFASYNKTWGSLAAVIITLTWLWLNSVAILYAADFFFNDTATTEIYTGTPPSRTLTAGHK